MAGLFDLSGQVAIVTGSSRGIGRAIAIRLAEQGARVAVSSRKAAACDAVVEKINAAHPGHAVAIPASISSKPDLERLVSETRAAFGPISILVCNAASNIHFGSMSDISDEMIRKIFENNVMANHWLAQMVLPEMIERRDGAIILVSSIGGLRGSEVLGAYNVTKAADMQLARNLAVEHGRHNIRTNCIAPGLIRTDFSKALWEDPDNHARAMQAMPMKRLGEADDIAGAAVFLASAAGRYVNGETIVIDGGLTISTNGI
ncbi:SDR family NAD(P)-dependent oxidoreductase [Sphingosinicella soli]|uniref:NAD(P)-dependent dehydrogenase (Short-subunit alcohol dehydrogenase family) n=1 Tax=Sphingosinicella soli TaxID=333708 RepID=A0A7W7B0U4_9SPHN|nr:SDR family oxidoreductase [Sphingosinicella soli]MBB4631961.1 NAD(P)-dependent dehydrogenase (short-subunit alcohol dehydrogenase family) [Sphingosinicella soli]